MTIHLCDFCGGKVSEGAYYTLSLCFSWGTPEGLPPLVMDLCPGCAREIHDMINAAVAGKQGRPANYQAEHGTVGGPP